MFTLTEVASLNDIQATYRILKPWWDVFMDYLAIVMLMVAIFAGTMQLTKDQVVCLPRMSEIQKCSSKATLTPSPTSTVSQLESRSPHDSLTPQATGQQATGQHSGSSKNGPFNFGRPTNLEYQQYIFINQMCYHEALPWYSKYFPYLALIHTLILMVSSNFWFKYPKTSSKIEHFVSILGKCFESPWTTKALSETACEDSEENKQRFKTSVAKHLSTGSEEESPSSSTPMITRIGPKFSTDKPVIEVPSMTILDKKDGEQAKALFEKVRKFRAHVEDSDLIYKLYVVQTVIKTLKLTFIYAIHLRL